MAVPCQTERGMELTSDHLTATTDNVGVDTEYVSLYSRAVGPYQAVLQLVLVPCHLDYQVQVQPVVL